jgi:Fur family ferric uptake transcriptional regulator
MDTTSKLLRDKGHRITNARQEIFKALTPLPQSVNEISLKLKDKKIKIDLATIYRTLDFFISLGLVDKSLIDEKNIKFELKTKAVHQHHLICEQCKNIENIPLSDAFLISKVEKGTNFIVKRHILEFIGICSKCKSQVMIIQDK